MNNQRVSLLVALNEAWDGDVRFQCYTDFGDGSVDFTKPLLARAYVVFPGHTLGEGIGDDPLGDAPLGDGGVALPPYWGFEDSGLADAPLGDGEAYVPLEVPIPPGYGSWKFVVRALDSAGNVQTGGDVEITAFVNGTEPPPLRDFALSDYSAGKATFSFTRVAMS